MWESPEVWHPQKVLLTKLHTKTRFQQDIWQRALLVMYAHIICPCYKQRLLLKASFSFQPYFTVQTNSDYLAKLAQVNTDIQSKLPLKLTSDIIA